MNKGTTTSTTVTTSSPPKVAAARNSVINSVKKSPSQKFSPSSTVVKRPKTTSVRKKFKTSAKVSSVPSQTEKFTPGGV